LVSMLKWKNWGMAPDTVEVGGAGEESGGTGEEVAKASEDVGGGAGKEIGGGGGGDSDKEVKGGDVAGLDVVLPLCWLPPQPFPPLPEPRRPVLSTGAGSASMGAPRRGDDWHWISTGARLCTTGGERESPSKRMARGGGKTGMEARLFIAGARDR